MKKQIVEYGIGVLIGLGIIGLGYAGYYLVHLLGS